MNSPKNLDILRGPLAPGLLRFALPLALTGVLQQLFNAADVAVVGQFCGKNAMAAVSSNAPVVGLMINLFVGLALGSNVVLAHFIGQGNPERVARTVHQSILIALVFGFLMAGLGILGTPVLLRALSVPEEVLPLSILYLRIYSAGMPVILLYNFLSAVFRGSGDTRTPLLCLATGGVFNVALNLFFVRVLGRSVDGVAIATVASNTVSSLMLFIALLRGKGPARLEWRGLLPDWDLIFRIFRIGIPAGIQGMVFSLANLAIQSAINGLGASVMAASGAAFNVEIFAYYVITSFNQACTTFVGQNYGAGQTKRCFQVTRIAMGMDLAASVIMTGLLLLFADPVLALFNPDPEIIALGKIRMYVILLGEPLDVVMEVLSGALRGFGQSLPPALLTLAGVVGTRLTWITVVFPLHPTFFTIVIVFPISWLVTAAGIYLYYIHYRRHLRTAHSAQTAF